MKLSQWRELNMSLSMVGNGDRKAEETYPKLKLILRSFLILAGSFAAVSMIGLVRWDVTALKHSQIEASIESTWLACHLGLNAERRSDEQLGQLDVLGRSAMPAAENEQIRVAPVREGLRGASSFDRVCFMWSRFEVASRLKMLRERQNQSLRHQLQADLIASLSSTLLALVTLIHFRSRTRMHAKISDTAELAHTDWLTNLPNRRLFYQQSKAALVAGESLGIDHALLLIDLDGFKAVNDTFGHEVGDTLLRQVSVRLQRVFAGSTRIARLGGDEFALLLRCDPATEDCGPVDPLDVAARIVAAASQPFVIESKATVKIGASVGISVSKPRDCCVEKLLHEADVALYLAKADGKNCCRKFEASSVR